MHHATFVPQALEAEIQDPFQQREILTLREIQTGLDEVSVTKRRLVRVCKTWKDLAIPILYSAIIVHSITALRRLFRALHRVISQNPSMACGMWVRRLDIVFDDKLWQQLELERSDLPIELMAAFRRMPRLEILAMKMPRNDQMPEIWETIFLDHLRYNLPSLRILHWPKSQVYGQGTRNWMLMLDQSPHIIACPGICLTIAEDMLLDFASLLSRLTYVKACFDHNTLPIPPQPLAVNPISECHVTWGHPLPANSLSMFGSLIARLSLDVVQGHNLEVVMSGVIRSCPALRQMVLHMEDWSNFGDLVSLPERLEHLGLVSKKIQHQKFYYSLMTDTMQKIIAPKLTVIKFISGRNVGDLHKHPRALAQMVTICNNRKVWLWDHTGTPMIML
jgi:hypothetical protein